MTEKLPLKPFIVGVPEESLEIPRDTEIISWSGRLTGSQSKTIQASGGLRVELLDVTFIQSGSVESGVILRDGATANEVIADISPGQTFDKKWRPGEQKTKAGGFFKFSPEGQTCNLSFAYRIISS